MELDVLVVNPWIYDFTAFNLWARPVGILKFLRLLQIHNIEFKYLDMMDYSSFLEEIPKELGNIKTKSNGTSSYVREEVEKPVEYSNIKRHYYRFGLGRKFLFQELEDFSNIKFIVINSMMTYWYRSTIEIIDLLKERFPNSKIICGGIYPTLMKEHIKKNSRVDYLFPDQKSGVEFICNKLFIKFNKNTEIDHFPLELYKINRFSPIYTSLGCPLNCPYCSSHIFYKNYNRRNIDKIVEEIQYYVSLGIDKFAFYDDALLNNFENHLLKISEIIMDRFNHIKFYTPNGLSISQIDEKVAQTLKKLNVQDIRLSLETSDKTFQKKIGKKATIDQFERAIDYLTKAGFTNNQIKVYLLAGLPEQSYNSVKNSIKFVNSFGIKSSLSEYSPVPGTLSFKRSLEQSPYPLLEEPLYHNRIILPIEGEINRENINELKKIIN